MMRSSRSYRKPLIATFVVGLLASSLISAKGSERDGNGLLRDALTHHDPSGAWANGHFRLTLESSRPDGSKRETRLEFDNAQGRFIAERATEAGLVVANIGPGEACTLTLDGSLEIPAETVETLSLTCERWRRMRDYYSYMWGLPMKLSDPGTLIDSAVERTEFNAAATDVLRVTYEAETGGDTWYFYFEPESGRATGYRFYHDEAKNDGEYIVVEGEVDAGGVRFPRLQTWYMNDDDELLGSDELIAAERLD